VLVERLERQVLCDRQIAALMRSESLPDVGAERARLDAALAADQPQQEAMSAAERDQLQLRRVLGVSR